MRYHVFHAHEAIKSNRDLSFTARKHRQRLTPLALRALQNPTHPLYLFSYIGRVATLLLRLASMTPSTLLAATAMLGACSRSAAFVGTMGGARKTAWSTSARFAQHGERRTGVQSATYCLLRAQRTGKRRARRTRRRCCFCWIDFSVLHQGTHIELI